MTKALFVLAICSIKMIWLHLWGIYDIFLVFMTTQSALQHKSALYTFIHWWQRLQLIRKDNQSHTHWLNSQGHLATHYMQTRGAGDQTTDPLICEQPTPPLAPQTPLLQSLSKELHTITSHWEQIVWLQRFYENKQLFFRNYVMLNSCVIESEDIKICQHDFWREHWINSQTEAFTWIMLCSQITHSLTDQRNRATA